MDVASANGKPPSLDVLLDWLTTQGNYDAYRGGPQQSDKTKEVLCGEIVAALRVQGIDHHSKIDFRTKIGELERSYRKACDWLSQIGQGILDSNTPDYEVQINSYLQKLCEHYNILQSIMSNRPSARPAATSETQPETPAKRARTDKTQVSPPTAWSRANDDMLRERLQHDKKLLQMEAEMNLVNKRFLRE